MTTAPRKAPRRLPRPPSTTTTNASMMMNSPMPGDMARTGIERAPPSAASQAPRTKTPVKSRDEPEVAADGAQDDVGHVGAEHVEAAVGEVQHAQHAEDQRQPGRDEPEVH